MLGRTDAARERMAQMVAAANKNNPFDVAVAAYFPALLMGYLREYELAEESAAWALELSEKYQFPDNAALSRCLLGNTRAHLGRATEGIGLIRQRITELLKVGARLGTTSTYPTYLAAALERESAVGDARRND